MLKNKYSGRGLIILRLKISHIYRQILYELLIDFLRSLTARSTKNKI